MGVLMKSGSGLIGKTMAESGVAMLADMISEGKFADIGVESFSSFGLLAGILTVCDDDLA